jgi:hypothetical protein
MRLAPLFIRSFAMSALSVSNSTIKAMNAALAHIGVPEITSFLDESLPARVGNLLFEDTLENALSQYPWRFALLAPM